MRYLLIVAAMLTFTWSHAQDLDSNAVMLMKNYPTEFQNTIGAYAKSVGGADAAKVTKEINVQSDALISLLRMYEEEEFNSELKEYILMNSKSGFEKPNKGVCDGMGKFNLDNAMKLHVNWEIVEVKYSTLLAEYNMYFGW